MSYEIRKSDNTLLATIEEGKGINNDIISGIGLIAKLTSGYGATQSENFVHLAENFANMEAPTKPIKGQLFYNTEESCLYLCKDDKGEPKWEKMLTILTERDSEKTYQTGDLYFDVEENSLQIYNNGQWVKIGPDNYSIKRTSYNITDTDSYTTTTTVEIPFESNGTNLVTMKVVASEIIDEKDPKYGVNQPACSSWVYKFMVQSYFKGSLFTYITIGTPTYELVGRTDDVAKDWKIEFKDFNDNKLQLDVSGKGHSDNSKIKWVFDIEVVKA